MTDIALRKARLTRSHEEMVYDEIGGQSGGPGLALLVERLYASGLHDAAPEPPVGAARGYERRARAGECTRRHEYHGCGAL